MSGTRLWNIWIFFWHQYSIPFSILKTFSESLSDLPPDFFGKDTLKFSPHGMDYTPEQWVNLVKRLAVDYALESYRDIMFSLGSDETGTMLIDSFAKMFPDDLPILDQQAYYFFYARFNNTLVDKYQQALYDIDMTYGPARRRSASFTRARMKVKDDMDNHLNSCFLFHNKTLNFIHENLYSRGEFAWASDYLNLKVARDPLNINAKVNAAFLKAIVEKRILSEEEIKFPCGSLSRRFSQQRKKALLPFTPRGGCLIRQLRTMKSILKKQNQ